MRNPWNMHCPEADLPALRHGCMEQSLRFSRNGLLRVASHQRGITMPLCWDDRDRPHVDEAQVSGSRHTSRFQERASCMTGDNCNPRPVPHFGASAQLDGVE